MGFDIIIAIVTSSPYLFRLSDSEIELAATQGRLDLVGDYDRQISKLRSEIRLLTLDKRDLLNR